MKECEVVGDFHVIYPLEKAGTVYEEINLLKDVITSALEKDHIKVKRINVRIVHELKREKE